MNKFKFASGPYEIDNNYNEKVIIRDKDGRRVALMLADFPMSNNFIDANVKLFAAAPDMLKVLIDNVKTYQDYFCDSDHCEMIQRQITIIEKATGQTWEEISKEGK